MKAPHLLIITALVVTSLWGPAPVACAVAVGLIVSTRGVRNGW